MKSLYECPIEKVHLFVTAKVVFVGRSTSSSNKLNLIIWKKGTPIISVKLILIFFWGQNKKKKQKTKSETSILQQVITVSVL